MEIFPLQLLEGIYVKSIEYIWKVRMDPVGPKKGEVQQNMESKGSEESHDWVLVDITESRFPWALKVSKAVAGRIGMPAAVEDLNITKDNLLQITEALLKESKTPKDTKGYISFVKQASGVVSRAKTFLIVNEQAEKLKEKNLGSVASLFKKADTFAKSFVKPTRTQQIEKNTQALEKELETLYGVCIDRIERQVDAIKEAPEKVLEQDLKNRKIIIQEAFDFIKAFPKERLVNDKLLQEIVKDCESLLGLTNLLN